jgi:hypothetical protein
MEKWPTPGKLEIVLGQQSGFEDIIREIPPKPVSGPIGIEGACSNAITSSLLPSMNWVRFLVPVSMVTDRMSG